MSSQLLASKIVIVEEEPAVRNIAGVATAVTGFLGVTERGPVGVATLVASVDDYQSIFGSYTANGDVRQSIDGFFQNGGSQAYVVRTVHYTDITDGTTKTSLAANTVLQTGAVAAFGGTVLAPNVGPYLLADGQILQVDTEAISPTSATFSAAAPHVDSGTATFNITDSTTLFVKVDGGSVQTVTFHTSNFVDHTVATAAEVAAVIQAGVVGASTVVASNKARIASDTAGLGGHIQVTGGTANGVLGYSTSAVDGTGNVQNIRAVTVAEVISIVQAAVTGVAVTNVGGAPRITRSTATGSSATVQVTGSTTATAFGFDFAIHAGGTGAAVDTLQINGKTDGTYAHALKAKITDATSGTAAEFNLTVLKNGLIIEAFPNVTMDSTAANYVETIVNDVTTGSKYISAEDLVAGTGSAATDRPVDVTSAFLSGGNDGLASIGDSDFTGSANDNDKTGMRAFDLVQGLNLLVVPGRATSAVHNAMLTYCEVARDLSMFAILDPPAGASVTDAITYFESTAAVLELSEFGAAYWPRIKVLNPNKTVFGSDDQIVCPPSGHIAGVYARTDGKSPGGVFEYPAGVDFGVINGCLGFDSSDTLEEAKRDLIYPKRINPLTSAPGLPRYIDGTYTLKSTGDFPNIAERRGATFIEQSIKVGLQFARHKKNTEELRASVARTVEAFLLVQMKNGAFRSNDPAKAFFVDFGDGLNTDAVQFAGQLVGRIGIATAKPATWIILRFSQDTRALEEELAASAA